MLLRRPEKSAEARKQNRLLCATLWALAFSLSSCILNPQPQPPSASTKGSGGAAGGGGSSGSGGVVEPPDSGVGTGGSGGSGGTSGDLDGGRGQRPCVQAQDCAADEACSADDGKCGRVPPTSCGPPRAENGSVVLGGACDGARACAAGLTCVPYEQTLEPAGNYAAGSGTCQKSCDPCAPICEPAESCFRRSAGGGFCARALLGEGAPCDPAAPPTASATVPPCAAGLSCSELEAGSGKRCVRYCRPLAGIDGGGISSNAAHSASASPDCLVGELCFETVTSAASGFACVPGRLAESGGVCGGAEYCAPPERCTSGSCRP